MRRGVNPYKLALALLVGSIHNGSAWSQASSDAGDELALQALLRQEVQGPSRYAQSHLDAPAAVSVLGRKEAEALGHLTIGDMLARLPGVYLGNSRGYSAMGLRGFNRPGDYSARVLVAIDGNRVNDAIYDQGLPQLEFPLVADWVKRVELVQGPGSSIYGSNALLGVVNVVTLDGADAPGMSLLGSAGANGAKRLAMHYGQVDAAGGDLFVGVTALRNGGEDLYLPELGTPDGWVRGLDGERYASIFAKYRLGSWRAAFSGMRRDKDTPTAPYGTLAGVAGTWYRDTSMAGEVAYDDNWQGDFRRALRLGLNHYEYQGRYVFAPEDGGINRDQASASWLTLDGRMLWRGLLNHELLAGADFRTVPHGVQRNWDEEPYQVRLDSRVSQSAVGAYLQDQWRLSSAWQLTTGLRVDHIRAFDAAWSPRAVLVFRPDEHHSIKLLWARSFRPPNLYERFYDDGGGSQIGNAGLRPERLESTELAWEHVRADGLALSVNVYRTQMANLIEAVSLSEDLDALIQYRNVGRVRLQGVDLGVEQRSVEGWQWRASVSLMDARNDLREHLSNSPHWMLKGHVISPEWFRTTLGAEWTALGPRHGRVDVSSSVAMNFNLRYRIDARQTLALRVENALDRRNLDPSTPENSLSAVPQPRRNWRLDWRIGF